MKEKKILSLLEELKYSAGKLALFGSSERLNNKIISRYNQLFDLLTKEKKIPANSFIETNADLDEVLVNISVITRYYEKSRAVK